jgi:YVTN family beta-propeller protein
MSAMRSDVLLCLLLLEMTGCITPKPPTPTLTGPDTGWTRTQTTFTTSPVPHPTGADVEISFRWGDRPGEEFAGGGEQHAHVYAESGTYVVECRVLYISDLFAANVHSAGYGDWSNPCTVDIVPDTLIHPDSVYATVELSHRPSWSCVLPSGDAVYVTSGDDSSVYVLDPITNTCTGRIQVQSDPTCCIASAAGDRVYIGNHGSSSVSVVRTSDNTVVDTIVLSAPPDRLLLLPGDTILYVSHATRNRVSVLRLENDSLVASIAVRDSPCAMACTPDGQHVYVAGMGNDTLTVISAIHHAVEKTYRVMKRPVSVLLSPSGETAYVACKGSKRMMLYRCSDFSRLDSLDMDVQHLLMLPGNRCLYTISEYGVDYGNVRVYRRSDNFLLRDLSVGRAGGPSALPNGSRVYIPNRSVVTVLGPGPK